MNFIEFMKEKLIVVLLILFSLVTIEIFFMAYSVNNFIKIYVPVVILFSCFMGLFYELDEKYLITEVLKKPNFF